MGDWKKTFIEAEQERGGEAGLQNAEPVRIQVIHYVTVCLFCTGTILMISALCGILTLTGGWWAVVSGGCVGVEAVLAGAVVTWLGRGLSNTAIAQGYLVVGLLSVVSCVAQIVILILLAVLAPKLYASPRLPITSSQESMWAWVQFLGGAQGAMAVLLGGMVGGAIVVTSCCCKTPRDNVVGVYRPR
ncbi:uncharacterized protein LOC135219940 [Macrobrachium nipponense]|uniref:uncharacterized protein LOC135219940 n=1 Tax=Macrobrachium nipponense TaxID=159736 RepID=UPI0030C7E85E